MHLVQETSRITFSLYRQNSRAALSKKDFANAGMILAVDWIPLAEV